MGLTKSEYYLHQCSMKLIFSEISSCSVNVGINIFKEVLLLLNSNGLRTWKTILLSLTKNQWDKGYQ